MVHDRASGLFVPVYYTLNTSRTQNAYWDRINFVVQASHQQINPAEIVCDFEPALIDAVQVQFSNSEVLGCLFHLKQALRRAMKALCVRDDEASVAMTQGIADMLTVIDPEKVENVGIRWVKSEIKRRCAASGLPYSVHKWRLFWRYFGRTWIDKYKPDVWNVFGMNNTLVACTNNPLERSNREINSRFPAPRPSMATFVSSIKQLSDRYVQQLADIPRGRAHRVLRETIRLPTAIELDSDIESDDSEDELEMENQLPPLLSGDNHSDFAHTGSEDPSDIEEEADPELSYAYGSDQSPYE